MMCLLSDLVARPLHSSIELHSQAGRAAAFIPSSFSIHRRTTGSLKSPHKHCASDTAFTSREPSHVRLRIHRVFVPVRGSCCDLRVSDKELIMEDFPCVGGSVTSG